MDFTWTRVTGSQVICRGRCKVGSVIVTPNASDAAADVTLYDGENTGEPQIITIRSGTGPTNQVIMAPPLICERGLYVAVGSNVEECLVQWVPY